MATNRKLTNWATVTKTDMDADNGGKVHQLAVNLLICPDCVKAIQWAANQHGVGLETFIASSMMAMAVATEMEHVEQQAQAHAQAIRAGWTQ